MRADSKKSAHEVSKMEETTKNKPVKEFREGTVSAAVFERQVQMKDGNFVSRSVKLQLGFKNKKKEWENRAITIVKKDIDKVLRVLGAAAQAA